jgi:uncharacterized membrane protein (UPF0136 family)
MHFIWNTWTFVNLALCVVILAFGLIAYRRSKSRVALYVGVAFGMFGLSHLAALFSVRDALDSPFIVIRTLAYLLVAYPLYLIAFIDKK